jgi:hypothetical protein
LAENYDVFELYDCIKTQWRSGGFGRIGLDYSEVRFWANELDIDLSPCMWKKIRILESLAVKSSAKNLPAKKENKGHASGNRKNRRIGSQRA